MDKRRFSWDHVVLGALIRGDTKCYPEINDAIEDGLKQGGFVNRRLFELEPRWGGRQKFVHTVRSTMSSLRKRGMVERVSRGCYRITDDGRKRLQQCDEYE